MSEDPNQHRVTDAYGKRGSEVDAELDQPDMAVVRLKNEGHTFSNETIKHGDEVEIKIGGSGGKTIFRGEVVGLEPIYKAGSEGKLVIRAFNKIQRLLCDRKSRMLVDQTDKSGDRFNSQYLLVRARHTSEHSRDSNQCNGDTKAPRVKRDGAA